MARRQIRAWEFVRRRFTRLYPLYGATQVPVILRQHWYFQVHGDSFVYPASGVCDLLQAMTLTSHWRPNQGWFFNGPGWSTAVECFLYLVFFLAVRCSSDGEAMISSVLTPSIARFTAAVMVQYNHCSSTASLCLRPFQSSAVRSPGSRGSRRRTGRCPTLLIIWSSWRDSLMRQFYHFLEGSKLRYTLPAGAVGTAQLASFIMEPI